MTLFECLWWCTGICDESRVTCMKKLWIVALPQNTMSTTWSCKAIWQWMLKSCIWWWWKLHGNISRNGYGNAMIGTYGGCFEEDIRRLMCERAYHITGFGCTGEVCTNSQCEKGQCAVPYRLENCGRLRVRIIHGLTLVIKNSYTYCKSLLALEAKYYYACP